MKRLSDQSFKDARDFLMKNGRDLEKSLFRYYFEDGSKEDVLQASKVYQNEDGGFGNKIEPDFQLEISSPMATSNAFQIFKELELSDDHPMIREAMTYLLTSYDDEKGRWHAVPAEVNDVPHAPWWHYDHEKEQVMVEAAWGNPNAELTGYLLRYKQLSPEEMTENLKERSLTHFQALDAIDMHETLCYLRLADELSNFDRKMIIDKVLEHLPELVDTKPEQWSHYGMQPVQVAHNPSSPFYEPLKYSVEENLDYIIDQQDGDGAWHPNWEWGQYEYDWPKAKADWKGILTLKNLKLLKSFDRIESYTVKS
ncbi:hypothetical protein [Pseudalkalibacillus berkeleyi]|uniref:Uncharacterized protein n=1 Tax=Pseudalkalibacillus berkeleyi TaxID=1069813 RepID=A0ABS9GY18_9BACL|nr:hypothetical protein [Pseudalkalibacillus berkeleyi]MCF6136388.1 hypothetical protein [Pseudalkalibacillus berkeleyi]